MHLLLETFYWLSVFSKFCYEYLLLCYIAVDYIIQRWTFVYVILICFVPREIRCNMSTSRSVEQWDEEFECLIDLTLGLMALNEGQRYVNHIQRMPMHTSIRTGHQYMLELINDHPDRLFNKIRMYRPCFEMLIQVLRQQTALQNSRFLTLKKQQIGWLWKIGSILVVLFLLSLRGFVKQ